MRIEVPECKRCCFCIPLRQGLITWGYFKLVLLSLFTLPQILTIADCVHVWSRVMESDNTSTFILHICLTMSLLLLTFIQIAFTVVFIIGGHKKNAKFLRVYFINSLVVWILLTLYILVSAILNLTFVVQQVDYLYFHVEFFVINNAFGFSYIVMELYFLLLMRSEITKLRNSYELRFVNNMNPSCFLQKREPNAEISSVNEDNCIDDGTNK